jgi:isoleucyl-tRNA synthetase
VHLRAYPEVRRDLIDDPMNARMERVLSSVSLGRAAREKVQIKVRQPLGRMWVLTIDGNAPELDEDLRTQIGQELNIKQVLVGGDAEALVTPELKLNFAVLGGKLGAAMKEVTKAARGGAWTLRTENTVEIAGHTLEPGEFDLQYAGRPGFTAAGDRNLLVVIDTAITEELRREGYAREMIRAVQDLRKLAGYKVEDRVTVFYETTDERVRAVIAAFGEYIAEETLALELRPGGEGADQAANLEIENGCSVRLGVKR